jgi:ABC-2 type transport system permease protein
MNKFYASLVKEVLILFRDFPGLAILFIMPIVLIMITTVAQENALKASRETKTELLFVDKSHSVTSEGIKESLESSGFFHLNLDENGQELNETATRNFVRKGTYSFGMIIEPGDSIRLIIDPAILESYKTTVLTSLTSIVKGTQSRMAVEGLMKSMSPAMSQVVDEMINSSLKKMPPLKEEYPVKDRSDLKPTLSQNSIPGFILFAMFFIVIPLSGSIINEKNEGAFYRLRTLPVPPSTLIISKVTIYLAVCLVQFLTMVFAGAWLLPVVFGLSAFNPGNHYIAILVTTLAAGLAAIGFGLIIGTYSTTHAQAALFGSVMAVVLAFISGTFLPIHMFPPFFQYISYFSPLRWGIDNYLDIFLRQEYLTAILPKVLLLLLFFVLSMIISIYNFAKQK